MVEFIVNIAGCSIRMKVLHPETKDIFNDYLAEECPLFTIESGRDLIQKERQLMKKTDEKNSLQIDGFSDSEIESNYLYREVAEQLSQYGVVLLHGSAIAVDGEGYIFVAPSGTGKSTHARLWREVFGNRAVMINDDKPLLKCANDGVIVYGSPWNGKHHLSNNISASLKAICFLEQGKENIIEEAESKDAFLLMLKSVYHSRTAEKEACILKSLQCIWQKEGFFRLKCNMQKEAATVAYKRMNKSGKTGR